MNVFRAVSRLNPPRCLGAAPCGFFLLGALVLGTLGPATSAASAQESFRRGDANADGVVDVADASFLLRYIFMGRARPPCLDAADANDDSSLDIADPINILNHLFLGGREPPLPGPIDPGPDPTDADGMTCISYAPIGQPDEADFTLKFLLTSPAPAAPGETVRWTAYAALLTENNTAGAGAEAWSLSIAAEGARIASVTTDGTSVVAVLKGGFQKNEAVDPALDSGSGPQGEGAVSAVLLSFRDPSSLPPDGTSTLLAITLEAVVPEGGIGPVELSFVDGMVGSGQPVRNVISLDGVAYAPTFGGSEPLYPDCNRNGVDDLLDISGPGFLDFALPEYFAVGGVSPFSLAAGDFDGDGDLDVAAAIVLTNALEILENDGTGALAKIAGHATGRFPAHTVAADLDGDGSVDLVTANRDSSDVSVFLNDGDGAFAVQALYGCGTFPLLVATGDLDGDGDLDLVTSNRNSHDVSVLRNRGDGTFDGQEMYGAGSYPFSVTVGDLDADGDLDLAVSNVESKDISLLWNDGSGLFSSGPPCVIGKPLLALASADLDGDGLLDLAVTLRDDSAVEVLINRGAEAGEGDCPFRMPGARHAVGSFPYSVTAADWDEDGDVDLAVADYLSDSISLLANDGAGYFPSADRRTQEADTRPTFVTFDDADGDGHPDMIVANDGTDQSIRVFRCVWSTGGSSSDCNRNGVPDECDIASGFSLDEDSDGVPDECPLRPLFHRGDPNDDGVNDLSDGISIFSYLFLGGAKPGCLESADVNDDATIDISDGIYLLGYLFLGGPPPAAPGPVGAPCGEDPDPVGSAGDLGCETYERCGDT